MSFVQHVLAALCCSFASPALAQSKTAPATPDSALARISFSLPCDDYTKGLRGKGNFGVLVDPSKGPPFGGSYHLAEDVWLPAKTEVRAVADGLVRYSAFSPSWQDASGHMHWNLGNVIVIEHELAAPEPWLPEQGLSGNRTFTHVCSMYVHLGSDRAVKTGDRVKRGQRIGSIGADRSEENGRYPAHLHFGIHKGPYHQLTDTLRRELEKDAETTGLPIDAEPQQPPRRVIGKISKIELVNPTTIAVHLAGGERSILSLEIGSTVPPDGNREPPPDIMHWCVGYGEKSTVEEWLRPSEWIAQHSG